MEDPFEHALHLLNSQASTERQSGIGMLASFPDEQKKWVPLVTKALHDEDAEVRKAAIDLLTKSRVASAESQILPLLNDKSDDVQQSVLVAVKTFGDGVASKKLVEAAKKEDDPEMQIEFLETALELGNADAIPVMIHIIQDGGIFADDAHDHLQSHIPISFSIKDVGKVQRWWEANHNKLRWDATSGKFVVE